MESKYRDRTGACSLTSALRDVPTYTRARQDIEKGREVSSVSKTSMFWQEAGNKLDKAVQLGVNIMMRILLKNV